MEASELSKDISLEEFLKTYKIPGVGKKTAKDISEKVKNASTFRNLLEENKIGEVLIEVPGIGEGLIGSVVDTLLNIDFMILLEDMEIEEFKMFEDKTIYSLDDLKEKTTYVKEPIIEPVKLSAISSVSGLNFVITGTLSLPRRFIETAILKAGGRVQNGVNKNTDILVYSTIDGTKTSKYENAKKINSLIPGKIKVITEHELRGLLKLH